MELYGRCRSCAGIRTAGADRVELYGRCRSCAGIRTAGADRVRLQEQHDHVRLQGQQV